MPVSILIICQCQCQCQCLREFKSKPLIPKSVIASRLYQPERVSVAIERVVAYKRHGVPLLAGPREAASAHELAQQVQLPQEEPWSEPWSKATYFLNCQCGHW